MEIHKTSSTLMRQFSSDIPDLIWATGEVSYAYHFAERTIFNEIVSRSWTTPGSLFAADTTTVAIEDGKLMGIEVGMPGPEYKTRQQGLAPVWQVLRTEELINKEDFDGILERSNYASWLNPVLHSDTYYIHALSVKPDARGKRVGFQLIDSAMKKAQANGFKQLQLDVLSNNPAVDFYRTVGLELLAETRAPKPEAAGIPPEYRMGIAL